MAAKILCHSLELELLHGFVSCFVQRNNPTLDVCWWAFCVIMIIKTYIFFTFKDFSWYFSFCSFWLFSKFGNMVIQPKFDLLCMLSGPEKKVRRIVSLLSFFQQNSRWPTNHMLLWRAWTASPICSKEATVILNSNLVTVLYFSIINVLCGAGGDASFAPQANLVQFKFSVTWSCVSLPRHTTSSDWKYVKFKSQYISVFQDWRHILLWTARYQGLYGC